MTPEEEERVEKLHQESLQNQPQKEQMNAPFDPLLEDLDLLQDLDSQIPGVRQPSAEVSDLVAQRAAQDKRIAALEAEKAEREAEKERALERRNLAVQRRAEASGSKKAILARVPDDAKALAGEVLSRVQMGSASYVLGANRERLPATPAR